MKGKGPGRIEAEQMTEADSQYTAMGYDKNMFVFFCQQLVEPATNPAVESGYQFTAGELKIILLFNPLFELVGKAFFYLVKTQSLPAAEINFPQVVINSTGQTNIEELIRLTAAGQRAAIALIEHQFAEKWSQSADLISTSVRKGDITAAVIGAGVCGDTMPEQIDMHRIRKADTFRRNRGASQFFR